MTLAWAVRPATSRLVSWAAAVAATLAAPAMAAADDCHPTTGVSPCMDADQLWLHAGSSPYLSLAPATTTPRGQVALGLGLSYLRRPIVVTVGSTDPNGRQIYLIDNMLDGSFLFALGVTDRFELSLSLPFTFYQDGAGANFASGSDDPLPRSAIRDGRFGFGYAFLAKPRTEKPLAYSLVGRLEFGMPYGDRDAFAGARTATLVPTLTGDLEVGRVDMSAEIGARVRGVSDVADAVWGSEMTFALGTSVRVWDRARLRVGAEAFAHLGLDDYTTHRMVPAEWMVDVTAAPILGGDVSFGLSGGGGIPFPDAENGGWTKSVGTPTFRFTGIARYAPTDRDSDGDGVPDRTDKCPNQREDRDGFQDDDGCPDPDNDGDGIPDAKDRCRDEAEDKDGFQDDDGCPDLDDDQDGVPDREDQCRTQKEDRDGFQDGDGCPDPDNDGDGIPDELDACRDAKEDFDGVRDNDGCPDLDDDGDGVPDARDQCPKQAEDPDGFKDDDGCPDLDDDEDGIPDKLDQCPRIAETIDGNADGDGCPEPGAKSRVAFEGNRLLTTQPATFAPGQARATGDMQKFLAMVAQAVAGRGPDTIVIVEGFPDKSGDASKAADDLAARRALAVRDALVAKGISVERITAASADPSEKRPTDGADFVVTVEPKPKEARE